MKRILLSLAALAALASCVKENTLAPAADQLTISAVSADTKTTLDGLNVVWEKTDKIAVVVNANEKVTAEFDIVESTLDGSAADFVGTMEWAKGSATSAYAVYPAAAVKLTHTLPAAQTGEVSGLMLSAAALEVEDMQKGAATAEFHPALSLLQVAVPAGVKSVELTSAGAALVGDATFEVDPATGAVALTVADGATKTVSISAEEELEAKTYPVVVYPGEVGDLTLKLVGAKGETFEKTVSGITFVAAEARAINLMQIFQFAPADMEVAANGGTIELPFTTTVEKITVTENADWLESDVAVKGFQTGNVTLVAAANEGEEARTAKVTVSWGENKSVSFTLTQPAIYRGFLNDADGNPIQWEETFKVYASETDANAEANDKATYKNVFTIALNDEDYTKGTYKISNMFKTDAYYGDGYQVITNKGGEYYADYADGKLTVKMAGAKKSYFFTKDVVLTYDETAQKFTSNGVLSFDMNTASSYNRAGVVAGYAAVVKVEEPEVDNGALDAFVGTWSESFENSYFMGKGEYNNVDAVTVSVVEGKLYFENLFGVATYGTACSGSYYGTLSADGTTITLEDATSMGHGAFGPMSYSATNPIVLNVTEGKLTASAAPFGYLNNYVATKKEDPLLAFVGTWSESFENSYFMGKGEYNNVDAVTVSVVEGKLYFENLFGVATYGTACSGSYYGTLSADGTTITLEDAASMGHGAFGPMSYSATNPIVLNVTEGKLTASAAPFGYLNNYVATKKGAVEPEPEPEVPADPWENAASFTNDGTGYGAFMKELKVYADATNMYVRLTVEKQTAYCTDAFGPLGNYLDIVLADGEGESQLWWGWTTPATKSYKLEHKGDITDGLLTKMRWYHDPVNEADRVYVDYTTEEVDGNYVYNFTYPREWVDQYAASTGKIYVSFMLWNAFKEYWVIPQTDNSMLEVTLP